MRTAKVFQNGRSQAIRLPKDFRVATDEVYLKKTPVGFLVVERDLWELFLEGVEELSDDFMAGGSAAAGTAKAELEAMIYLLDTDMLIHMIRGLKSTRRPVQRQRAQELVERCKRMQISGNSVGISAVTISELEYGARNSGRYNAEIAAVRKILLPFDIFDYDSFSCPAHYGRIRHELEQKGFPIGSMDLLIAAHALALDATLVTNNLAHFSRVSGLRTDNWLLQP